MKAYIVIGAGYGDEGKGLTTDWLVSQARERGEVPMVARCNGGTQAAHTVVTPEGQRHVFKHHGSGSFLGANTYLGPRFILNPIGFRQERADLPGLTNSVVYCSPVAPVSLPVDMLINQALEELRGGSRHGSCGWGIGETLERAKRCPETVVTREELETLHAPRLREITVQYIHARLEIDGLYHQLSQDWKDRLVDPAIMLRWLDDADFLRHNTRILDPVNLDHYADTLICEGAQGLGLDEEGEHFPHVTRSKTGSAYPLELIAESGAALEEVVYVTRCYATRHGAGPLEREGESHGCTVEDPTNIPNQWQGTLRSAPLDMAVVCKRVAADVRPVLQEHPNAAISFMVTCIDQAGPDFSYYDDWGHLVSGAVREMPEQKHTADFMAGRLIPYMQTLCLLDRRGPALEPQRGRLLGSEGNTRATVSQSVTYEVPLSKRLQKMVAERLSA